MKPLLPSQKRRQEHNSVASDLRCPAELPEMKRMRCSLVFLRGCMESRHSAHGWPLLRPGFGGEEACHIIYTCIRADTCMHAVVRVLGIRQKRLAVDDEVQTPLNAVPINPGQGQGETDVRAVIGNMRA